VLQGLANGLVQGWQLERLAQDDETRFCRLRQVAVPAGENDWDLRVAVADLLGERDAVHAARHDDIAQHEIDLLGVGSFTGGLLFFRFRFEISLPIFRFVN